MPTPQQSLSDLALERYALGEGTASERQTFAAKVQADATLMARLTALQQSNESIMAAHPPAAMAGLIRARAEVRAQSTPKRSLQDVFKPLALAMAALGVIFGLMQLQPTLPWDITERSKGRVNSLSVTVEGGGPDAGATVGQVVSLTWQPPEGHYGMVLAFDGRQKVTVLYPKGGSGAAPALPHGGEMVHVRYQLDDAPGFERVIALAASKPFDMATAEQAARRVAAADDPQVAKLVPPEGVTWLEVDKVIPKR